MHKSLYAKIDLGMCWRVHVRSHASPGKDCKCIVLYISCCAIKKRSIQTVPPIFLQPYQNPLRTQYLRSAEIPRETHVPNMEMQDKWTNTSLLSCEELKQQSRVDTDCFRHRYNDFGHTNLGAPNLILSMTETTIRPKFSFLIKWMCSKK